MKSYIKLIPNLIVFALLTGCSSNTCFRKHIYTSEQGERLPSHPTYAQTIQVKYFGTSGFLIRYADTALLLAPFFSNHKILKLTHLKTDATTINTQMRSARLDGIESILVGHAHYDHLFDVPYIAQQYFLSQNKPLTIYGSQTMKNLISNAQNPNGIPTRNLVAITGDSISTDQHIGSVMYVGNKKRIRFRAIKSMHASHIGAVTFFKGKIANPVQEMPKRASQWKEGQTLAYLIDFLDANQNPIFRIHYQDTASDSLVSMPNDELLKDKAVDLSILCVASFKNVKHYPQAILEKLQPQYAILAHWENFFDPYTQNLDPQTIRPINFTNPCDFIDQVNKTRLDLDWKMPLPGTWLHYPIK